MHFNIKFYSSVILILTILLASSSVEGQCVFRNNAPEGELCETASLLCGSQLNNYKGKLRDFNSTTDIWPNELPGTRDVGVCGQGGRFDNTSWFSFVACDSLVTIQIDVYNCQNANNNIVNTGIQAGLYNACSKRSSVRCYDFSNKTSEVFTLSYNRFIPGQMVYLVLDGFAGSVCEFEIKVLAGVDTTIVAPPNTDALQAGLIYGPSRLSCDQASRPSTFYLSEPERKVQFSPNCVPPMTINPVDSICYSWSVTPSAGVNFIGGNTGYTTSMTFDNPGVYFIEAVTEFNPYFISSCANAASGLIQSWTVVVNPADTTYLPVRSVCADENLSFCGHLITKDTIINCRIDECTYEQHQFQIKPVTLNDLGVFYFCDGGHVDVLGQTYAAPGLYTVKDPNDCSKENRFEVRPISFQVAIDVDNLVLTCDKPVATLRSVISGSNGATFTHKWTDGTDEILNDNIQVTVPGTYTLSTTGIIDGKACTENRSIVIGEDKNKPKIVANIPLVRCLLRNETPQRISISSPDQLVTSFWTLPDGNVRSGTFVVVDSLNAVMGLPYKLSVTGINGCVLDTLFYIPTDFRVSNVSLLGDNLSCHNPVQTLTVTTSLPIDSIRWYRTSPNPQFYGSHISKLTHDITEGGIYRVDIMTSGSKCWNNTSTTVLEDKIRPDVIVENEIKWFCNTSAVNVTPTVSNIERLTWLWNTQEGKINTNVNDLMLEAGSPGVYSVTFHDELNGCETTSYINIIEETNVPTSINIRSQNIKCFGESNGVIEILNVNGGYNPYRYLIGNETVNSTILENLNAGIYDITIFDAHDCEVRQRVTIEEPEILILNSNNFDILDYNSIINLEWFTNYDLGEIRSSTWYDEEGNVLGTGKILEHKALKDEILKIVIENESGCIAEHLITLRVDTELKLFLPNIFAPNSSYENTHFVINKNTIPARLDRVRIYDRQGSLLFAKDNILLEEEEIIWDGTHLGQDVQPGVYIVLLEITDFLGIKKVLQKDVTLIR